jgi:hypothetical protein
VAGSFATTASAPAAAVAWVPDRPRESFMVGGASAFVDSDDVLRC